MPDRLSSRLPSAPHALPPSNADAAFLETGSSNLLKALLTSAVEVSRPSTSAPNSIAAPLVYPYRALQHATSRRDTKGEVAKFVSGKTVDAVRNGRLSGEDGYRAIERAANEAGHLARALPLTAQLQIRTNLSKAARNLGREAGSASGLEQASAIRNTFDAARIPGAWSDTSMAEALDATEALEGDQIKVSAFTHAAERLAKNPHLPPEHIETGIKGLAEQVQYHAELGAFHSTKEDWLNGAERFGALSKPLDDRARDTIKHRMMMSLAFSQGNDPRFGRMDPHHEIPRLNNQFLSTVENDALKQLGAIRFNEGLYGHAGNAVIKPIFESRAEAATFIRGTIDRQGDLTHVKEALNALSDNRLLKPQEKEQIILDTINALADASLTHGFENPPDAAGRAIGQASRNVPLPRRMVLRDKTATMFGNSRTGGAISMTQDGTITKDFDHALAERGRRAFDDGVAG